MTIPSITRRYRQEQKLTLKAFGEELVREIPGYTFTRQAVFNWEAGMTNPEKYFLLICAMRYGDWRRDWALDCLATLQPEIFAPAS